MQLAFILVIFLCSGLVSVKSSQKWSYISSTGPRYWHELFPEACGGKSQSPIDLKPEETMFSPELKEFAIWYDPPKPDSKMYIKNNGHTVQVDLKGDFFVTNGGLQHLYKAVQFHFHWGDKSHRGSEHLVEGKASPIEMHVVSFNQDRFKDIGEAVTQPGGLAVLGVLFQLSEEDNPSFDYIIRGMKYIRNPEKTNKIELPLFSLRDLLPVNMERYFRYNGSLTTPGCFETVTWTVFDQMQTISHKQMEQFRKMLQYRRKLHHLVKEQGSKHNKRELKSLNREMEHNAKQVLDELGIRGEDSKSERETLKDKLSDNKNLKPDVTNLIRGKEEKRASPGEEYVQDIIVNNYRPVQPVNGRPVYRSFKLREPVFEAKHQSGARAVEYEKVHSSRKVEKNGDNNAASKKASPLHAIFWLSIMYCLIMKALC